MKTLIFPCTLDGLDPNSGSARIRARWPAAAWSGAEVYDGTQRLPGYDLYIFQKAYLSQFARRTIRVLGDARAGGADIMLAFDLCDPDFESKAHRERLFDVLPIFDFAVAPTQPLVNWLAQWLPAHLIPDRVWLDDPDLPEVKYPTQTETPRCIWAGYERHADALEEMLPGIKALGLPVDTIILERPIPFPDFWQVVATRDILLNPQPERGQHRYKSDNKTWIAWSFGMPVAQTVGELEALTDPDERHCEANLRQAWVQERADVSISVREWEAICDMEREEQGR